MTFTHTELALITSTLSTMHENAAKLETALTLDSANDLIHAFSYDLGILIRDDASIAIVAPNLASKVTTRNKGKVYRNGAGEAARVMRRREVMERALKGTKEGIVAVMKSIALHI